jgi:hypothetical protein
VIEELDDSNMEENRQQWRLAFRCQFLPIVVCAWAETNTDALEYLAAQVGDATDAQLLAMRFSVWIYVHLSMTHIYLLEQFNRSCDVTFCCTVLSTCKRTKEAIASLTKPKFCSSAVFISGEC